MYANILAGFHLFFVLSKPAQKTRCCHNEVINGETAPALIGTFKQFHCLNTENQLFIHHKQCAPMGLVLSDCGGKH